MGSILLGLLQIVAVFFFFLYLLHHLLCVKTEGWKSLITDLYTKKNCTRVSSLMDFSLINSDNFKFDRDYKLSQHKYNLFLATLPEYVFH